MSILNIVVVGLVRFMPNVVVGWIVAAVILFLAFVVLIKFSASQSIEKRTYRYAS
jgi:hypothetical protein